MTQRAFNRIGVPYKTVVEECDFNEYAAVLPESKILVQPTHNRGLVVTRNWIWDYAETLETPRFWTFDDNIRDFRRWHKNRHQLIGDGTFLRVIEDFTERYSNVPVSGMQYHMFICRKTKQPPLVFNTRVYSNMLIQTNAKDPRDQPYRNEGFYNDDTDLCLRILKDGFCTILFNAFLIFKVATMKVKGGMTAHYQGDGRWRMAEELRRKHPDVTTVVRKWGRWQHHVDYRPFKGNRLKRKPGVKIPKGVNNYGMRLVDKNTGKPIAV
jgi:hypothetical protein